MDKLQPILVDSSDFTEIRENKCIYVDKTAYFHQLITRRDARRFFLARPRRFGKSLMIISISVSQRCRPVTNFAAHSRTR